MKFAAVISYANEEKIAEVRPVHREYLKSLQDQGKLFASGPFTDDSGALIIYEAEDQDEARGLIEADPFHEAGVFAKYDLRPWNKVF